jgi:putative glutamine amidotransferase
VGIPWRTSAEEANASTPGFQSKTEDYLKAVEKAGGEPVLVPLKDEQTRDRLIPSLDAFVLPGSPKDVDPLRYHAKKALNCEDADEHREKTDKAILDFALAQKKPVLAICYGFQMLNVYQGGSLIQDLQTELQGKIKNLERHRKQDPPRSEKDPEHYALLDPDSRLARIAGATKALVNSSHHQAIDQAGDHLKVTAHSADGIIEGFEWTGDSNWVVGVQWHPERRPDDDAFAQSLFRDFIAAAKCAHAEVAGKK